MPLGISRLSNAGEKMRVKILYKLPEFNTVVIAKDTGKAGCKILNKICKINTVEITRDIVLYQ